LTVVHAVVPPWAVPLTTAERSLVLYATAVAGAALLAMLARIVVTRTDVSDRYRPAATAAMGVTLVAFASYVVVLLQVLLGYDHVGGRWVPNDGAIGSWIARYADWSISVPLLVVEIIAVSAFTGVAAARARGIGAGAAFLMIGTGYLGGVVVDGGSSFEALLVFGIVSSVFFAVLYAVVIVVVLRSLPELPAAARPPFRTAMVVLVVTWFVYPIVFGLQGFTHGGVWTTTAHVALCIADVVAKVGFGLLLHRVARLRTAADVLDGLDTHQETIWVDQLKQSDGVGVPAAEVHLPLGR
jgi:bacteriorhodopsin